MVNYLTKKRKLNVPLFIVLLIFAFVPGIIYFIWTRFPTKVCADPNKGYGYLGRVIGAGVALAHWLVLCLVFEFAMTFIIPLIPSIALFVFAFFSKKSTNRLMLWFSVLVALILFGISMWLFIYSFASLVGSIAVIAACIKGFGHYDYHVLEKKEGFVGAEIPAEAAQEEVKTEE